jgi:polysaccharide pyruvyl transferase WcaK-like protein
MQRHGVEAVALRSQVIGTARKAQATGRDPAAPAAGAAHKRTLTQSLRATVRRIPLLAPLLRAAIRCMQGVVAVGRESVFIVRSWRRLRGTDMLLIAGSNQLEDWFGGPWGYPYTILLWTVLARAVGARVAFVCVGAGPLNSRLSRWLCVRALALASYASFRDAESLELMRRLGYRGAGEVVPDLAFALELEEPRARPAGARLRIAINVFPYRDPQYVPNVTDGGVAFAAYVDAIARFVVDASARGYDPVMFGSQRADRRVLDFVQERLRHRAAHLGIVERHLPATLAELIAVIDGSDVVVATRYHGILFGVFRGRPTIGICYQSKSRRLLEMAGLGDYAVDADALDAKVMLDLAIRAASECDVETIYARAMAMHTQCVKSFGDALERCLPGVTIRTAR